MTVRIGALQADAWAGLVLSPGPGEGFALRFVVGREGETADLDDLFWMVHEVGPHEPEGRYARVSFDVDLPVGVEDETPVLAREGREAGLTVEWGRVGDRAVVARATVAYEGTLDLRAYLPWDWRGRWSTGGGDEAVGSSASGRSAAAVRVEQVVATIRAPSAGAEESGGVVFRASVHPGDRMRFVAALDAGPDDALRAARDISLRSVDGLLEEAAAAWHRRRARVRGGLEGLASAVTDSLRWTVLLQPETGRLYTPAGRRWIFPRTERREAAGGRERPLERGGDRDAWTVFGWDSCFNVLELAVDAPDAARENLLTALGTAYPNGCVPNWRSRTGGTPDRSQPPLGSLAALKLHLRRPHRATLEQAWPRLSAWSAWWASDHSGRPRRAPGPRGLFTWGSDLDLIDPWAPPWERGADARRLAGWESGQDDLPTWDEAEPAGSPPPAPGGRPGEGGAGTGPPRTAVLAVDPVDLNAYRVLDLECLGAVAAEIGRADEAAALRREADGLRARVNEHLWDPARESYGDRRWDGSFTPCRTASHFLVLAAGIAPPDRARRMVEHLTDPDLFWGDFVVPTVSRDDPRFVEQQYWRGTIWPPINYLVRLGLARYGFDAVAGEVALRGSRLFLESWRRTGLCRENFDSRTGEGGGQRHQSWGPLLALAALEELADVTPWHGLRVGGLRLPGGTEASNLDFGPRGMLRVEAGPRGLRLGVDGREVLESDGPVVLRELVVEDDRIAAVTSADDAVELRLSLAGGDGGPVRWSAVVDGRREELSDPRLRLAAGRHRVDVRAAP